MYVLRLSEKTYESSWLMKFVTRSNDLMKSRDDVQQKDKKKISVVSMGIEPMTLAYQSSDY